ncbi:MAG: ATP-binding protein [Candidatus Dormibacteria bacterium]
MLTSKLGGLYMLYGPRRVGKKVSVKRAVQTLLASGVDPLRVVRITVDGWQANRLATLYEYVVRVLTSSVGDATRYWFVDEVTACRGTWWLTVKNLRDNTDFGRDCVVLTGSSNRGLDEAVKALAGRRGPVADPDRALLPMDFGDFCRSLSVRVPTVEGLRSDELRSNQARDTWLGLAPQTDDLVAAWQAYLEVGGEVDFAGVCPDSLLRATPLESKYVSESWRRGALGIRNSALASGILATRDVLEVAVDEPVWAVPASFVAFALSSCRRAR